MSTANVPAAPAPAPKQQPGGSDALDSLLARAAKAVAEDAAQQATPQQQQQQQNQEQQRPAAAAATPVAERPETAPAGGSPARPARAAAISLAALQLPRPGSSLGAGGAVPGARDSPRAQELFQNFAGSTPRPALGGSEASNKAGGAGGAGPRPCTPSFQPLSPCDRPATAAANFSIKSGVYSSADGAPAGTKRGKDGKNAAEPAAALLAPPRRPYPQPPSTAPAKANVKEAAGVLAQGALPTHGIMTSAFVAQPAKGAAGEEGAGAAPLPLRDLLASAELASKAGLRCGKLWALPSFPLMREAWRCMQRVCARTPAASASSRPMRVFSSC